MKRLLCGGVLALVGLGVMTVPPCVAAERGAASAGQTGTNAPAATVTNILPEGNFEVGGDGQHPAGFDAGGMVGGTHPNRVEWGADDSGRFIRVFADPAFDKRHVFWFTKEWIPWLPDWKRLTLKVKVRTRNFSVGSEPWHDARVIVKWRNKMAEDLRTDAIGAAKEEQPDWIEVTRTLDVPEGAYDFKVELGTFGAQGTIDFDDLQLIPQ